MNFMRRLLILISILFVPMAVFAQGLDTAKIDQAVGRSGQKLGDVYKVGFPRTDVSQGCGLQNPPLRDCMNSCEQLPRK